ncbi:LptF/LptG family permease [Parachlamydia acanthamoebae]|uniref:Permease YjgP/YjgQ family protein n=2 Tax=Parachlamydia acanthamoebae TaxID=83552 RepID=F8L207_PARAV|nr:LptF/LptG family permease [Parachlamydia acanthamoebae]CCB87323.1 putative uncharacterized protein [Parachlamydia acanthamoebae UV-7]
MLLIWRYLLLQYFQVLSLSTVAFVAILLTTRFDEIAHFAALGAAGSHIIWFIVSQIPYILPIVIPISSLIASLLLIQRLSQTHELTALRASGWAIRDILYPILIAAAFIALLNFYIVSELATNSHLQASLLKKELRSINPLLLLNNKHLMRVKGAYFHAMGNSRVGEFAKNALFAMPSKQNNRIQLMIAKSLHADSVLFIGNSVTNMTTLPVENGESFDHFVVENLEKTMTPIQDFSLIFQRNVFSLSNDHLKLSLLIYRMKEQALHLRQPDLLREEMKQLQKQQNRSYAEIIRRFSLAIAVFSFTLMGCAFGMNISRHRSNKGVVFVIALAVFYLISYFTAKGIEHHLFSATLLYLIPHLLILGISSFILYRVSRGIE